MYSEGISREGGLIDLGLEMGLVKKSGAWFNVGDIRLGQGRENAKDFRARIVMLLVLLKSKSVVIFPLSRLVSLS